MSEVLHGRWHFFPQKWHKIDINQKGKVIDVEETVELWRQESDGGFNEWEEY